MAGRGFLAKIGKASIARAAEEEGPAVLQILPAMEAGGIERSAVDFAQAVTRARGRALVVSEGGQMERHLQRAGARHISMPLATRNPARVRGNIEHLSHIIRSNGVDILHLRSRGRILRKAALVSLGNLAVDQLEAEEAEVQGSQPGPDLGDRDGAFLGMEQQVAASAEAVEVELAGDGRSGMIGRQVQDHLP